MSTKSLRGLVWSFLVCGLIVSGCQSEGGGSAAPAPQNPSQVRARARIQEAAGSGELQAEDFSSEYMQGATLVYFSKPGCSACLKQDPHFQSVMENLPKGTHAIKIYQHMVDLDRYGIDELPTLVVYQDGKPQKRFVGVTASDKLVSALESAAR